MADSGDQTTVSGGDKVIAKINEIVAKLSNNPTLSVGFLSGPAYPDGTPVATVAAIIEYGGQVNRTAQSGFVSNANTLNVLHKGTFIPKSAAASTPTPTTTTTTLPPNPYFRTMIQNSSPTWGASAFDLLTTNDYNIPNTLNAMGSMMVLQLQQSIANFGLINTGTMISSVDFKLS